MWHSESKVFKKWSREEGLNAADLSDVMPIEPLDLTQIYLNEACGLLAVSLTCFALAFTVVGWQPLSF